MALQISKHIMIEEVENGFYAVYRDENGDLSKRKVFNKLSDLIEFVSLYFEKENEKK